MSYMGSTDRFGHDVIEKITTRRGQAGAARAIYTAMRGVNDAEDDIARATGEIRRALDGIASQVAAGYRVQGDLDRHPAQLAAAIAARQTHYDYLAALLTRKEAIELGIIEPDPDREQHLYAVPASDHGWSYDVATGITCCESTAGAHEAMAPSRNPR